MAPVNPGAGKRPGRSELFVLSADSREALATEAGKIRQLVGARPSIRPADLAFSLNTAPSPGPERLAVVASGLEDLARKLDHAVTALDRAGTRRIRERSGIYWFSERLSPAGKVAFVFPGEGCQYPNMLSGLCMEFPEARACFDRIDRVFSDHERGYLPSQFVFPREAGEEDRLWQMDGAVEAVFTANAAIHAVLGRLAVRPDMIVGHSTGDYSALMASGCVPVTDEESLLTLMLDLNGLYQKLEKDGQIPEATLVAVGSVEPGAARSLVERSGGAIQLAMDNCPHQFVLAGSEEALKPVMERLQQDGALLEKLPFSRAYHTPGFEPVCRHLMQFYGRLPVKAPGVPTWSAATAAPLPEDPDAIRRISVAQWAQPVLFQETIQNMYEAGARIFVEAGPRGNLTAFITDILRKRPHLAVPADLRQKGGIDQLLHLLGVLSAHGVAMDLAPLYRRRRVEAVDREDLTPAPKARRRMVLATGWPEMRLTAGTAGEVRDLLGTGRPAAPATEVKAASPASPIAEPKVTAPAPPAGSAAGTLTGKARDQVMSVHFQTMDRFLRVQEEVMRAALSGTGESLEGVTRVPAGLPAVPADPVPSAAVIPVEPVEPVAAEPEVAGEPSSGPSAQTVLDSLVRLVSDRTGYPAEMIDPDLDLEADLGIDSIKRVEILGSFQKESGLAAAGDMDRLSSCKTLSQIVDVVVAAPAPSAPSPTGEAAAAPPGDTEPRQTGSVTGAPSPEEIRESLVRLVSDRTGYPAEMIGLDLDLEADLGIDSIKKVEILGSFQKESGLVDGSEMESLQGRKSLGEIIEFVTGLRPTSRDLDTSMGAAPSERAPEPPGEMPFIREITGHRPGEELTARVVIDGESALFMKDHCLGRRISRNEPELTGLPVVPLTMTMEILAEAAAALAPGRVVIGMREIRGHRWLVLRGPSLELKVTARFVEEGRIETAIIEGSPDGGTESPAAEGVILVAGRYPDPPADATPALKGARPSKWAQDRLYEDGMFHGPAFRGVASMDRWAEQGVEATVISLERTSHFRSGGEPTYVTDPVLLDQPGQVVGLWTAEHLERGYVVFPFRLEGLDLYGPPPEPGRTFRCTGAIELMGDHQVRSDLDLLSEDGGLHARLTGWWDRRFDLPRPFARLLLSPESSVVSEPWPAGDGELPLDGEFRGCQVDSGHFPQGFFRDHGGFWSEVLSRVILSGEERRKWRSMTLPEPRRIEWLLGRAAAKDAARSWIAAKHGLQLTPAEVEIRNDDQGCPFLAGEWSNGIEEKPTLSLSHADGVAVALVGTGSPGSGNGSGLSGLGVDVERLGRVGDEFAGAAFSEQEILLLEELQGAERDEWALRCWCAKEAVAKALGRGFMGNPRNLIATRLDTSTGSVEVIMAPAMAGSFPSVGSGAIAARTWKDKDRIYGASICERSSE